jgi:hypothetical protein
MRKPRKPLPRPTKPIARYTPPKRSSRPIPQRRKGKPRRRAGACRPYLDWLKTQACRVTGRRTGEMGVVVCSDYIMVPGDRRLPIHVWVDPAHVRTKRNGGDLWNAISLSRHLHEEQHQIGIPAFDAKYGCDMGALAIAQTEEFFELFPDLRVQYTESR